MNELKNNAMRLAYALAQRAEDPNCVEQLAEILNYIPSQLAQDMHDLRIYLETSHENKDKE